MKNFLHIAALFSLLLICFKWGIGSEPYAENPADILPPPKNIRTQLADFSKPLVDSKYRSAGRSPKSGFDCSGFTHYVFKENGITLPTHSVGQARTGVPKKLEQVQAGDLIFFKRKDTKKPFHVAMVFDNVANRPRIIHSTSSRGVVIDDLLASKYWRTKIWKVRDVILENE